MVAGQHHELGQAELGVIRALWDCGPSTVREVMNHLHQAKRKLAYTTVLTFLTRLEQKGYVSSDKSGLAYIYRAVVSRGKVSKSRLRTLVEQLYDGSAGPLVVQLMQSERFSAQEIEELRKLIDQLDRKSKGRKPKS